MSVLDGNTMGYTLLALQVGLIAYWRAASFEPTLSRIVEAGGDTDTNGAVAGALLGARLARFSHGFSSRRVGDAVRATARSPRRARSGAFVAPDQARQGA